jgi:hypothetical protein
MHVCVCIVVCMRVSMFVFALCSGDVSSEFCLYPTLNSQFTILDTGVKIKMRNHDLNSYLRPRVRSPRDEIRELGH